MGLWVGDWYRHTYKIKGVYLTLILGGRKLRNFLITVKNTATVDAHGDVNSAIVLLASLQARLYGYLHTCVGFGVACSTVIGNAKASDCGTSNKHDTRAFLI